MSHNISIKLPRARKAGEFVVYPFDAASSRRLRLQSDNHCIIALLDQKKMVVSKRFAQYPRFEACHPAHGGKIVDIPADIQAELETIASQPTGKEVNLT